MDTAMLTQVLALASLSGVINGKERDISDTTKGKLVTACYDRAILLTEVTDYVLVTHLQIPPGELEDIHSIQAEPAAVSWGTLLARWNSGELKGHIEE